MLRRVRRVLRISAFATGLALFVWLVLSRTYLLDLYVSWGSGAAWVGSHRGSVQVITWNFPSTPTFSVSLVTPQTYKHSIGFSPGLYWPIPIIWEQWPSGSRVVLPLWQLCAILLAVPLLPFVPRKRLWVRKEPHGFPIEPSVAPLPMGEVPSESASEAERASARSN